MENLKFKNPCLAGRQEKSKLQFKIQNFKFLVIIFISAFYILNCLGCAALSKKDKSSAGPNLLEPQALSRFSDIPVPAGFKLLAQDSYTFESAGVRVGVLKYRGKANTEQVINFYKEQMPMYNWNLLNLVEYGERLMNFERENETCIISLLAKGNTINLAISVGPKSQIRKKSDKPVK